ncbi:TetR family transcriptional regulator [Actinocatenispora comari]|uniref:TetR family transcriptional regulator n=1 Tax=Actinocatenispora comari TaxID=2807577 RepID=A0A8J4EI03_9ACTN|nr:TetR family transcriptional regulator [Actinocatenispora comari]
MFTLTAPVPGWQTVRVSRRDEVLHAALDLLDEVGLDALTTRRLAERLGVQPGALYRHFPSKRALLTAMIGEVTAGGPAAGPPPADATWDEILRAVALEYRNRLLRHRDGARLVATGVRPEQEAAQAGWRWTVSVVRGAGLDEAGAMLAVDTVFAYANGFAIEEQARGGFPPVPAERAERDAVFHAGLDLIIAGITATAPA